MRREARAQVSETKQAGPLRGRAGGGPRRRPGQAGPGQAGTGPAAAAAKAKAARQARAGADAPAPEAAVLPVAGPARPRQRHRLILAAYLLLVALPLAVSAWYLWTRAVDQYHSTIGFSVRREEIGSSVDFIGGLSQITGVGGTSDSDILYRFIQSQELVSRVDTSLDLRGMWSRHHAADPVFSLDPGAVIEDMTDYWQRMVRIAYEPGTGLIELRVMAFDPVEAQTIAREIFNESMEMINGLSTLARSDATRYAAEDLDYAVERLKSAREDITAFRIANQIVDPQADIQSQMGLLSTLQTQLAASLIELDMLRETARETDPRITQTERRIEVIEARIRDERAKFGAGGAGPGGEDYGTIMSEYERLAVEREFAEQAYRSAMSAYDGAVAEAQRQSRYLAAHIAPTRAESARYPQRWLLLGLVGLFCFLATSVLVLVYYSIRDRR